MYLFAKTLDDLLRKTFTALLKKGVSVTSTRGISVELIGVMLELKNPRARLSRTETKGKVFSGLAELLWYLSGSNDLAFIGHYLSQYKNESDDGVTIYGGYGPRLFGNRGHNQVENVLALLAGKGGSRRAVIQLFNAEDLAEKHRDIPCTCLLQFMRRNDQLHMVTYMRSNDAFWGLPHDIFAFTMLQEIIARKLGIDLGTYKHAVGSLHLYQDRIPEARVYLDEGWQSTDSNTSMPAMPMGDPDPAIALILASELEIRMGRDINLRLLKIAPYWKDLIRLLQIFKLGQSPNSENLEKIYRIKRSMSSNVYDIYIDTFYKRKRSKPIPINLPQQLQFENLETAAQEDQQI